VAAVAESWLNQGVSKRPLREPDRREDARIHGGDAQGRPQLRNYITPGGLQRLKDEQRFLLNRERPAVTQVVAWAASNGDRSENADYQYNKRRLRQIDRRIRFLTQRIDAAEVVDPEAPRAGQAARKVFFGATVRYVNGAGAERIVRIVGLDEIDLDRDYISWKSPLASALMKAGAGDSVMHACMATATTQVWIAPGDRMTKATYPFALGPDDSEPAFDVLPALAAQL